VRGRGKDRHLDTEFRDDLLSGAQADAGDLIEGVHRIGVRGDHLLDPGVQFGVVGGDGVDARSMVAQMNAWWSSTWPVNASRS
jgi:hypothetical protein